MINLKKHLLAAALAFGVVNASATVLFTDNFNYAVGSELYNQGLWVKYGSNPNGAITITSPALTFTGYQDSEVGGAADLTNPSNSSDQDLQAPLSEVVTSGSVYMSALVNVSEVTGTNYVLSFNARTANSAIEDGKSVTNTWRLMLLKSDTDGKFKFGLAKNTSNTPKSDVETADYDLNTTYLVVMKYTVVDGSGNDELSLYINSTDATEPSTPIITVNNGSDVSTTYGIGGIGLNQTGTSSRNCPKLRVDAMRVATTWAELFEQSSGDNSGSSSGNATIAYGKDTQATMNVTGYLNVPVTLALNIKGENLSGDIMVAHSNSTNFSLDATSISKADANQGKGAVNLTFVSSEEGTFTDRVTFIYGLSQLTVDVTATATKSGLYQITNARGIQAVTSVDDDLIYQYTGTATVTFIDSNAKKFYAQDATGGLCVDYQYLDAVPCAVGDKLITLTGSIEKSQNINYFILGLAPTIDSSGNEVNASEATLEYIDADPGYYLFRLLRLSGVTITPNETGTFSTSAVSFTQGDYTGKISPLAGTNLIGADIPTTQVDIVGISRSLGDIVISPRSTDDITAPVEFTVTEAYVHDGNTVVAINTSVDVIKLKVSAKNLPSAIALEVTGSGRAMYSVSPATIDAGTSETDVVVTYTPTAVGKHQGYLYFDSYDGSKRFTFAAYDPANPPTMSINTDEITQFEAAPGDTEMMPITVTTANFIDYGSVKVMGEGNGAFRITQNMLLKNGETVVNVTFAPTAAGTYTERIEFSALGVDTQYVTVTGVCSGTVTPDETEGDKFDLDVKTPLTLLNEKFDSVTHNKVLSLSGWTNVANQGTRAWWGYDFGEDNDNNKAAKVTAYDSKIASGAGETCQMTLVTPALDFVESGSKILTFRVMGQNLTDDMTDKFEVLYMDLAGDELYTQVLENIDLPDTEDESGEWSDYIIDFEGQELADTFFIGFRFTSTRGIDNSAVYYVDDVTWGRTDVPQIKPAQTEYTEFAFANQDLKTTVTIHGLNLTDEISLSVGGDHPSSFSIDKTTLPSTGGDVTVTFNSSTVGVLSAYLILKSTGAATAYVSFEVNNLDNSSVTTITADENGSFTVYNLQGVKLMQTTDAADLGKLARGIYVVNGKKLVVK